MTGVLNKTLFSEENLLLDHWKKFEPLSQTVKTVLGLIMVAIFIVSTTGHTMVLVLFCKYKSLRSAPNIFVVNLSAADLGVTILSTPVLVYNCFTGNHMGKFECFCSAFLAALMGFVSITSLTALAVNRSIVIRRRLPMTYPEDKYVICIVIMIIWVISGTGAALPFIGIGSYVLEGSRISCTFDYLTRSRSNIMYNITIQIVFFYIPLALITSAYVSIFQKVRAHEIQYFKCKTGRQFDEIALRRFRKSRKMEKNELKTAKSGLMLVIVFCISWLPYSVICLIALFGDNSNISPVLVTIPGKFAKLSTILNPLLYVFNQNSFKRKLMLLYCELVKKVSNNRTVSEH